ncbi:hypothetical protein BGX26_003575 [Mortierella sp. AD094]|nr:hypothetical protein BGX26_003575 [Mortierella sp. AD094]
MSIINEAAAVAEEIADLQSFKITCRNLSSYRVVHLLYQTDVDLFDAIQEWKDNNPTLWVDDAINAFATVKSSDAIAQLVYSTEAFDIILKYDTSDGHIAPILKIPFRLTHSTTLILCPQSPLRVVAGNLPRATPALIQWEGIQCVMEIYIQMLFYQVHLIQYLRTL